MPAKLSVFLPGAGIRDDNPRSGGIFRDLSKLHCRSINVDLTHGSVILIFLKIHCRVCYAAAENGSANRDFLKKIPPVNLDRWRQRQCKSRFFKNIPLGQFSSGSINRENPKIHCRAVCGVVCREICQMDCRTNQHVCRLIDQPLP